MGMDSLNDMFFTSTASESLSYDQILEDVQKYCTEKHSDKLSTEGNQEEARKLLREFIFQYVISRSYRMEGMTTEELCDSLYEDMAGISFLKKWIYKPGIEEVNINAFDDIEVIMSGGRSMKIPDRFQSPQHAIDVTRRLLNTCGMVIDDFYDANISHNDLMELTVNHLHHASLTPEFFTWLALKAPAFCKGLEKQPQDCEKNCSRYYRCSDITMADDRSKRWESLSSLLAMHIHGGCTCSKDSEEAQCPAAKYLHGEWDISEFFHAEERQEAV